MATAHNVVSARSEILPLTGLRFVAAFFVFLFHIHHKWPLATGWLGNALNNGAAGMSLFFVLSGYVLSYQYSKRKTSFKDYCTHRAARIYPIYLLAALLTLPWLFVDFSREGWPLSKLFGMIIASATATQAWFPSLFRYWNHGASCQYRRKLFSIWSFP